LAEAIDEGKILYYAVSNYFPKLLEELLAALNVSSNWNRRSQQRRDAGL